MSKLKCSKTRPSCARCETRGIDCQYFGSRRPGRRRQHGIGRLMSCTIRVKQSSRGAAKSRPEDASSEAQSTAGDTSEPEEKVAQSIYSDDNGRGPTYASSTPRSAGWPVDLPEDRDGTYSPHAFSVAGDLNLVPQLKDEEINRLMADLEDSLPESDTRARPVESTPSLRQQEETRLGPFDPDTTDPASMQLSQQSHNPPTTSTPSDATPTPTPPTKFTCICTPRALTLLHTLSSPSSSPTHLPTTNAALYILFQHKRNMAAVRRMLSCAPCVENTFLLAILSLVVLNILERYATALQRQVSNSQSATCVDHDTVAQLATCIISNGRVPCRVIVSELCRLQSLVNHLAPRAQGPEWLVRMEGELRGHLGGLAGDVMERLRRHR
ncbi:hypothetical protein BJX64DRAFT_288035 [Aspergillus heterothallicus]